MLDQISQLSTYLIAGLAVLHLGAFLVLAGWARRERRSLAQTLNRFTEGLPNRSQLDWGTHLADQIDGFLADIDDVLAEPQGSANRSLLRQRMQIIDERRDYLQSSRFETAWNVARTMIEAYPLAGVLGTICAIGAALAGPDGGAVSTIVSSSSSPSSWRFARPCAMKRWLCKDASWLPMNRPSDHGAK